MVGPIDMDKFIDNNYIKQVINNIDTMLLKKQAINQYMDNGTIEFIIDFPKKFRYCEYICNEYKKVGWNNVEMKLFIPNPNKVILTFYR